MKWQKRWWVAKSKTNESLSFFCGLFSWRGLSFPKKKKFCFFLKGKTKRNENENETKRSMPLKKSRLEQFCWPFSHPFTSRKTPRKGVVVTFSFVQKIKKMHSKIRKTTSTLLRPFFLSNPARESEREEESSRQRISNERGHFESLAERWRRRQFFDCGSCTPTFRGESNWFAGRPRRSLYRFVMRKITFQTKCENGRTFARRRRILFFFFAFVIFNSRDGKTFSSLETKKRTKTKKHPKRKSFYSERL